MSTYFLICIGRSWFSVDLRVFFSNPFGYSFTMTLDWILLYDAVCIELFIVIMSRV